MAGGVGVETGGGGVGVKTCVGVGALPPPPPQAVKLRNSTIQKTDFCVKRISMINLPELYLISACPAKWQQEAALINLQIFLYV